MSLNTIQGFYDVEDARSPALPKVTQATYHRTLLKNAKQLLVYDKFGTQYPLKQRSGMTMVWRRYKKLAENTVPLTEGVTPAGKRLEKEEITATIKQYGDFIELTDLIEFVNFDPIVSEAVEKLGDQMLESHDTLYANMLSAGTNAFCVTGDYGDAGATAPTYAAYTAAVRLTVDGVLNKAACDKAINLLDRANAEKFTGQINATDKVSTYPIPASYICIIHPDIERDLRSKYSGMTFGEEFTPVERYAAQSNIYQGEIGRYRSIRFVATTHSKMWAGAGNTIASPAIYRNDGTRYDVYSVLFLAKNAYGIVPLEGGSARTIIKPPTDPLNQRKTIGWKSATTLAILDDANMLRMEVASLL